MAAKVNVGGKTYTIVPSTRKGKQLQVKELGVHFGDPTMPEYPGTKRGDNYCARSFGIKGRNDIKSPNFWSRHFLWNCQGKLSLKNRPRR